MARGRKREFYSLDPCEQLEPCAIPPGGAIPIVEVIEENVLAAEAPQIAIRYTFPGFFASDVTRKFNGTAQKFKLIEIPGTTFFSEPGCPLLPAFGRFLEIPGGMALKRKRGADGSGVLDYKVVREHRRSWERNWLVFPAQESLRDAQEASLRGVELSRKVYASRTFYPRNRDTVLLEGPFDLGGLRLVLLYVVPLVYNAHDRRLVGTQRFTIRIFLKTRRRGSISQPIRPGRESVLNMAINPAPRGTDWRGSGVSVKRDSPELLLIHVSGLEKAAHRLANWKSRRGLAVKVISAEKILGQGDHALRDEVSVRAAIRETIQQHVRYEGVQYVQLIGDVKARDGNDVWIPAFRSPGNNSNGLDNAAVDDISNSEVTDYYYSTEGEVDGAPRDRIQLPRLAIGRIPTSNLRQAMQAVDQIIRYEATPPEDPAYYRRLTFAAVMDDIDEDGSSNCAYVHTMERIRRRLIRQDFEVRRVYVSNSSRVKWYCDGTPVPVSVRRVLMAKSSSDAGRRGESSARVKMRILTALRDGSLVLAHRGHGKYSGWDDPALTVNDLENLSSAPPTVVFSLNCCSGGFQQDDCFAKAVMLHAGVPAVIAATGETDPWRNDSMMRALFDGLWAGVLPTFPESTVSYPTRFGRIGDVLNYAKAYVVLAHPANRAATRRHLESYHVIGDPTLEVWRGTPTLIDMAARISDNHLEITMSTCPRGSVITIWDDFEDKVLLRFEPVGRYCRLPVGMLAARLGRSQPGPVSICFKAPDCRYREKVIQV